MKIEVTYDDILAGRPRDPRNCPVAIALRRAGVGHFGVNGVLVLMRPDGLGSSFVLPGAVQEWILDFDWGLPVAPMEFNLPMECPPLLTNPREARRDSPIPPRVPPRNWRSYETKWNRDEVDAETERELQLV